MPKSLLIVQVVHHELGQISLYAGAVSLRYGFRHKVKLAC